MLSEKCQTQKATYCMTPSVKDPEQANHGDVK